MNDGDENERWTLRISVAVTVVAVAAIAAHLVWPRLKIDFITVTLLAIASLPWLRGIVSSVDLPGGASIKLAARQRAVAREQQQAIDAVRAVATAGRDVPLDEKLARIYELADEYENIRENMPSGHQRTQSMGRVARKILSLMPLENYNPDGDLLSSKAGRRLVAYLALFADSDGSRHVEELIRALTEREGIPFNQSWALRALSQIEAATGMNNISSKSVARLKGMRDGLRPGSDRQLLLADLVDKLS
jgi:hypothetical protein